MASEMEFSVFLKGLQRIVGEQNVVYHSDDLLVFEYDGSIDRRVPEAVVFPSNTREVSEVISLAYSVGIPVAVSYTHLTLPTTPYV